MNKSQLEAKKIELENQFNEVQKQAEAKKVEFQNLDDELKRLQGRYSQVEDLLKEFVLDVIDDAKTIVAKAKGADNGSK